MKLRLKSSLPKPPFGLWDSTDKCWLGDDKGPTQFTDWDQCRLAAAVASEQLEGPILQDRRIRARVWPASLPKHKFRYKDEIKTRMSPLQAIQNIEGFCEV